jgi:hypothetical protein
MLARSVQTIYKTELESLESININDGNLLASKSEINILSTLQEIEDDVEEISQYLLEQKYILAKGHRNTFKPSAAQEMFPRSFCICLYF